MNENKFAKIFTVCGFLAFAAVSCWATAESLHLLLPSWPAVFCWAVTIGFFFIASWGTKMITDSLNQNIYMEKRGLNLFGGIVIVLIFWLICSMPTNTHTFFYRNLISSRVSTDLTKTMGYLAQIKDGTVTKDKIKSEIAEFENKVRVKMAELEAEIKNDANPGLGEKSRQILSEFATLLDVPKIEPLTYSSTSVQGREKLCNAYRKKIFYLKDSKIEKIRNSMTPANDEHKKEAARNYNNLKLVKDYITDNRINLNDANDIKTVCDKLNEGYSTVKMYSQFVDFKTNQDREAYMADNPKTKVSRLLSVFDVWYDFLTGKDGGLAFVFWIIISILIDLGAFIFFDIAFKKAE